MGIFKTWFLVEPGKSYELKLPEKQAKTQADFLNPYFEENEIQVNFASNDSTSLNAWINKFESVYNPYFNTFALSINAKQILHCLKKLPIRWQCSLPMLAILFHAYYLQIRIATPLGLSV